MRQAMSPDSQFAADAAAADAEAVVAASGSQSNEEDADDEESVVEGGGDRKHDEGYLMATSRLDRESGAAAKYEVVHEWVALEYDWPSAEARADALASGAFVPENNALTGLKVCTPSVRAKYEVVLE